jgi:beta-xylosidase
VTLVPRSALLSASRSDRAAVRAAAARPSDRHTAVSSTLRRRITHLARLAVCLVCALALVLDAVPTATAAAAKRKPARRTATHTVKTKKKRASKKKAPAKPKKKRPAKKKAPAKTRTAAARATAAAPPAAYSNPVFGLSGDAPDPYVLDDGGAHNSYYAFTTGGLFPILHSSDLVHWTPNGTAFPSRPLWVQPSGDWHPWAPSVVHVASSRPLTLSNGCYVMYYVGLSAEFHANCVAVATATSPAGPYTDHGPLSNGHIDAAGHALGCGDEHGYGMIDPSPFVDPATGRRYLYASEDFACPESANECDSSDSTLQPTLSVIPLSADGMGATGPRTPLMSGQAGTWEAANVSVPKVEGPTVLAHNGTYYLLYSGGNYRAAYGMGYATAPTPTGPFTRGGQILSQTASVFGPGGGDTPVVGPHGGLWLVYHARSGSNANPRTLWIDPFSWTAGGGGPDIPTVAGPTSTPQTTRP